MIRYRLRQFPLWLSTVLGRSVIKLEVEANLDTKCSWMVSISFKPLYGTFDVSTAVDCNVVYFCGRSPTFQRFTSPPSSALTCETLVPYYNITQKNSMWMWQLYFRRKKSMFPLDRRTGEWWKQEHNFWIWQCSNEILTNVSVTLLSVLLNHLTRGWPDVINKLPLCEV
jgi:hypothetical protein